MITYLEAGNLFACGCQALVNAVNTRGVMGAGLALQFRSRWPRMFVEYKRVCAREQLQPGGLHSVKVNPDGTYPEWIFNVATKDHWKNPSRLEWVEQGIAEIRRVVVSIGIASVGIPALGCGLGGLQFSSIRPIIDKELGSLTDVDIRIFQPRV